jgi:hypothetical protein
MDATMSNDPAQMLNESMVTYEELQHLEYDFDDVDLSCMRHQYQQSEPLYARRSALTSKIEHFWPLVFEQAPSDFDQYISPSDSRLFAECLRNVDVSRPEIETSPRSVRIRLTFASPNDYFEDEVLDKTFHYRRAKDNDWTGFVSEPVKIRWKKGKDLTNGLTDAAYNLWQKKQKQAAGAGEEKLPEEKALIKKLENAGEEFMSFFTLFAFISERRYVSAEESIEANAAHQASREKRRKGEVSSDEPQQEPVEEDMDEQETEVCPNGAVMATVLAEDIWPNAIKYFSEWRKCFKRWPLILMRS